MLRLRRLGVRPRAVLAAGAVPALLALAGAPTTAGAVTNVPAQAEADGYVVGAQATVLGTNLSPHPIQVGPVSPAASTVPPSLDASNDASLVNFDSAGAQPLVDYLNVLRTNTRATLASQASTGCAKPSQALTSGFENGTLTGGNACTAVAQVGLLNTATPPAPASDFIQAAAVESQSLTQSCTATPVGHTNIVRLSIGGQDIIGGSSPLLGTDTPAPNTVIPLGVATVILNEQHYDNHGHGLTVNAIHVFTAVELGPLVSADVVIGHAHSEANCVSGTTDTGSLPPPGGSTPGDVPVVTKTDSTKHANPGETVTYTISIDPKTCTVTRVTDVLPTGFAYVSATGSLTDQLADKTPAVSTQPGSQQTQIDFFNPSGFTAPLTETIVAKIDANEAPGMYVNNVTGQSSPPAGTAGCGQFQGEDSLPVTNAPAGSPPGTNGDNPGIIVPRPSGGTLALTTPTPTPSASAQAVTTPGPNIGLANTGSDGLPPAAPLAPLAVLAGVPLLLRRRNR